MKLAKLDKNLIGQKLGTTIKTFDGKRLVNENTKLSERLIERLKNYGMNAIYIEDENLDIELKETLEDKRGEVIVELNSIYDRISKKNFFDEYELRKLIKQHIFTEISNEPVSLPVGKTISGYDIAQHSLNVCLLSIIIGMKLGLGMDKLEVLAEAALLHDIGKLLKNDKKEKGHEQLGYEFLKNKANSIILCTLVKFHHETIDGKGPQKLEPKNQSELIRILSICNYYENLLFKERLIPNEAFEKLQALINVKFDPDTFDALRKSVYIYPLGLPVKLNNGEEGIIIRQNKDFPLRPFVRIKKTEHNLLEHLSLFIAEIVI